MSQNIPVMSLMHLVSECTLNAADSAFSDAVKMQLERDMPYVLRCIKATAEMVKNSAYESKWENARADEDLADLIFGWDLIPEAIIVSDEFLSELTNAHILGNSGCYMVMPEELGTAEELKLYSLFHPYRPALTTEQMAEQLNSETCTIYTVDDFIELLIQHLPTAYHGHLI